MTEYEYQMEEAMNELYREHEKIAIEEFTVERLQSFYHSHPLVAQPPLQALDLARKLLDEGHRAPAQVFAAVAVEVRPEGRAS